MNDETKGKIYAIKEIMKLPVDKETETIKTKDVHKLVEDITETIPNEDVEEFLKKTSQK